MVQKLDADMIEDGALIAKLDKAGGTMTGALILSGAPTTGLNPATKTYVDELLPVASQAEQETGTTLVKAVVPGRQRFHQSAAKVWALFGPTGNLLAGYGVASITDDGTGLATVVFSEAFSSANYAVIATANNTAGAPRWITVISQSTGSVSLRSDNLSGVASDPTYWSVVIYGDLP